MYYRVYLSSGAYTIDAADAEDAAWQGLTLSKDLTDFLIDVEPIYDLKEAVLTRTTGRSTRTHLMRSSNPYLGRSSMIGEFVIGSSWTPLLLSFV